MTTKIIDGRAVAFQISEELRVEVSHLKNRGIVPRLSVILAGDDQASHRYVRNKLKVATGLGIATKDYIFPKAVSEAQLLDLVALLNEDNQVHGVLVQLPLPEHINSSKIIQAIAPEKDVDGLHPLNLGLLLSGNPGMIPCTPGGILELCWRENIIIAGREVVVVGRSNLVGKPVAHLLLKEHATVTICHSRTPDLPGVCKKADILVVAIGRAQMIDASYVKKGATVIDVGINIQKGHLVGDVDLTSVQEVAGAITPVPGGVGPLTIIMLMKNTIIAAER